MYIEKLASLIINDVVSGLRGYHANLSLNRALLEDEIVSTRLAILHLYFLKGIFPIKDLLLAIDCIDVDCKSIDKCSNCNEVSHFLIPQLITYYGKQSIEYIGSVDKNNKFTIITSLSELETKKYKKRGVNKPYVWIDYSPNENGMLDCYLFNAPFVEKVSIVAVFKDPRQLNQFSCCTSEELNGPDVNISFIDTLVREKLTKEKIYYYRQLQPTQLPNNQEYVTGG